MSLFPKRFKETKNSNVFIFSEEGTLFIAYLICYEDFSEKIMPKISTDSNYYNSKSVKFLKNLSIIMKDGSKKFAQVLKIEFDTQEQAVLLLMTLEEENYYDNRK